MKNIKIYSTMPFYILFLIVESLAFDLSSWAGSKVASMDVWRNQLEEVTKWSY